MMRLLLVAKGFALLSVATLAACSEPATVRAPVATDANESMTALSMPDGSRADMSAVPLYPGSKTIDMKIMPHLPNDDMHVNFESPADPATVRDWYAAELGKKGFALTADASDLVGTDAAGKPIRIKLRPAAGGHSRGTISKG